MEHDLLTHLLQLDDPAEQLRVAEQLRGDPDAQRQLALLRKALEPLEADRDLPEPPADLFAHTLGRIAEHLCAQGQYVPANDSDLPVGQILAKMTPQKLLTLVEVMDRANAPPARWRRGDLVVAASILVVALGLVLTATVHIRQRHNMLECQNQLRNLYGALDTYSGLHNNEFPRVNDTPPLNTAGSFLPMLRGAGTLPASVQVGCPAGVGPAPTYAYTLGYREGDRLFGLRHDSDVNNDYMAILADRPPDRDGAGPAHSGGQNVLFISGNVRFCTTTRVGVDRDDIYQNQDGLVAAGKHRYDSVLGIGPDQP